MNVEDALKKKADELGLQAFIAEAGPFAAELRILRERAARGHTVPFVTYEPARRAEPAFVLPGVKSLVAVAMPYHDLAGGPIARYARGPDYHQVLHAKLETLSRWLEENAGTAARTTIAVDTTPLIDRAVAARAGLGFYGKHGGIITYRWGSLVTLGTLLTTLSLRPDPPLESRCGACDLCIQACPTGAIVAPGEVDPLRCLSTWTQMRGSLPDWVRPALGTRVFGCDTCQEVCPYNTPHLPPPPPRNHNPASGAGSESDEDHCQELCGLATMDEATFQDTLAHTAAGWRGRNVLRRNAAVALGNLGDRRALPVLDQLVEHDPSPVVREHADWARTQIRNHGKKTGL